MSLTTIPVLTYHSHRFLGHSYETNDHLALPDDLKMIQEEGFLIVPLTWVVEWYLGRRGEPFSKCVAITFDDGCDLDWFDFDHPLQGRTKSFKTILSDFKAEVMERQPTVHASAFVIASPVARKSINDEVFPGQDLLNDYWWKEADRSGILGIHNHSWDHNHPAVKEVCQRDNIKGSFVPIDTFEECQCEVKQAGEYIGGKIHPAWPDLFAYPYGPSGQYMRETYFPRFQEEHRISAAFGASGGYLTRDSCRWDLPRFVLGASPPAGWRTAAELRDILRGAMVHPGPIHDRGGKEREMAEKGQIKIERVEEVSFFIGELFYTSFRQPAPTFPVNYVAFSMISPSVFKAVGYIHMTEREEYGLVGGLCVAVDCRHRKLGETLLRNVEKDIGEKRALFVQTNNPTIASRVGYQPTQIQYLMVKWMKPLSGEEQEKMIQEVAQVGPF